MCVVIFLRYTLLFATKATEMGRYRTSWLRLQILIFEVLIYLPFFSYQSHDFSTAIICFLAKVGMLLSSKWSRSNWHLCCSEERMSAPEPIDRKDIFPGKYWKRPFSNPFLGYLIFFYYYTTVSQSILMGRFWIRYRRPSLMSSCFPTKMNRKTRLDTAFSSIIIKHDATHIISTRTNKIFSSF